MGEDDTQWRGLVLEIHKKWGNIFFHDFLFWNWLEFLFDILMTLIYWFTYGIFFIYCLFYGLLICDNLVCGMRLVADAILFEHFIVYHFWFKFWVPILFATVVNLLSRMVRSKIHNACQFFANFILDFDKIIACPSNTEKWKVIC